MRTRLIAAVALSIALTYTAKAQVPGIINYQGRVVDAGTNFDGTGQFKFALVNSSGTTNYWSNDGTAAGQPSAAVSLTVTKGLYSILLGDTSIANMTAAIMPPVFSNSDVRLRVWFNDGVNGSQQLSPDQRLGAAGYALVAIIATTVTNGSITSIKLADGAVTANAIATGAVSSNSIATASIGAPQIPGGQVVKSLNGLNDAVTLAAGANVSLSTVGNTVTISSSGGGGGGGDVTGPRLNIGTNNTLSGSFATIAGGSNNVASGQASVVGGGWLNSAGSQYATVAGGAGNTASGQEGAVGGGSANTASAPWATVAGGQGNTASGQYEAIGGGQNNGAIGDYATIPGGLNNSAPGAVTFAAGFHAQANHNGVFIWNDSGFPGFASTSSNQFLIHATGGVGIGTNAPVSALHVNGTVTATTFSGNGSNLTGVSATIADGSITASKLATGAVTSASIATGAVSAVQLAGGAVSSNSIATASIGSTQLAAGAVQSGNIANGQVVRSFNGLSDAVTLAAGNNMSLSTAGNIVTISSSVTSGSGFPWQVVTGTNQQAASNTGYVPTNATQVMITLPPSPNAGDVVRVQSTGSGSWQLLANPGQLILGASGTLIVTNVILISNAVWTVHAPTQSWQSVASSADGSKLVATTQSALIYSSIDTGATWTATSAPSKFWESVASSADGTKLAAAPFGGQIYISTDFGSTWTPRASIQNWLSVAASSDGTKFVAVAGGFTTTGHIYTSTDSGVTWTPQAGAPTTNWVNVASSADGTKLVALVNGGQIYTSGDSGITWTSQPGSPSPSVHFLASSADGTKLVAVGNFGQIYTSTDSGVTWTARASNQAWFSVASSADGTNLAAVVNGGQIYLSTNSGVAWTADAGAPTTNWVSIASSSDGSRLAATAGQIWHNGGLSITATNFYTSYSYYNGTQGTGIQMQYIGNNQFLPLPPCP